MGEYGYCKSKIIECGTAICMLVEKIDLCGVCSRRANHTVFGVKLVRNGFIKKRLTYQLQGAISTDGRTILVFHSSGINICTQMLLQKSFEAFVTDSPQNYIPNKKNE